MRDGQFKKGIIPWNKGKIGVYTETALTKMSDSRKKLRGNPSILHSEGTKQKMRENQLGEKNSFYGKEHSEETKNKLRKRLLGRSVWWLKGKQLSEDHKKKLRGKIPWNKGKSHSQETIKKMLEKRKYDIPNGPELYLDFILQNHFPDEWKYVGDGNCLINGLCPDFINCNGKKQIIELFGEYWHKKKQHLKLHSTEDGRKDIFAQVGFSMLTIWDYELTNEQEVIEKITFFVKG